VITKTVAGPERAVGCHCRGQIETFECKAGGLAVAAEAVRGATLSSKQVISNRPCPCVSVTRPAKAPPCGPGSLPWKGAKHDCVTRLDVIGLPVLILLGIVGVGAEVEYLPFVWRSYSP
jgi:hypothetical protein